MSGPHLVISRGSELRIEIGEILELRKGLIEAGFNPGEVDYLIKTQAENKRLGDLDTTTAELIRDDLRHHLELAIKCKEIVLGNG